MPSILNPNLARFSKFMQENGNLQDSFPTVHIAGTNGKGSTVAILDSVLREAGLNVGRFTGPHLLRWNERFHVGGQPISDMRFAELATVIRTLSEQFGQQYPDLGTLSWFEFLTAMGFFYFAEANVDIAVIEVGLGGTWDATNVLTEPIACAITTIDLDHTHILGGTIAQIAREKSGIIKRGVPLVTAAQGEAADVIKTRARELNAPVLLCSPPDVVIGDSSIDAEEFRRVNDCLALKGGYQRTNGLVADVLLQLIELKLGCPLRSYLAAGLSKVYWPGRFQYLSAEHILLDGAHNVAGATALRHALDEIFPTSGRIFVLSFFQNKDVQGFIEKLIRPGDRVFASQAQTSRAVSDAGGIVDLLCELGAQAEASATIAESFESARALRTDNDLIIASGSFATIKECVLALGWQNVEQGREQTWISLAPP